MFKAFTHLWAAAADLSILERKRSVWVNALIGAILVVLVLLAVGRVATWNVTTEHPLWDSVVHLRIALTRLALVLPLPLIGFLIAVALYQIFENTDLGNRLVVPSGVDDAHTEAAKVANGGRILAALIGSCVLGVILGTLK